MANNKRKVSSKISENKVNIIILIGLVITFIIGNFLLGSLVSLFFTIFMGIILFIARILDKTKGKKKKRRLLNIILIIILSLMIIGILSVLLFFGYIVVSAPKFDVKELYQKESSIIYDKDGNEIRRLGSELRENIEYDDLPQVLVDALIATEDSSNIMDLILLDLQKQF